MIQRETKVNCQYKLLSRCFSPKIQRNELYVRERKRKKEMERKGEKERLSAYNI